MRRGVQMSAVGMLGAVLVVLVVLGLIFWGPLDIFSRNIEVVGDFAACDSMVGLISEGRCFADDTCGNQKGWKPVPLNVPCPDERPKCCYLEDEDAYYGAGTVLLHVESKPKATFRLAAGSDHILESGESGSTAYLVDGIPMDATFRIQYRPELPAPKYCQLSVKSGSKNSLLDEVTCNLFPESPFITVTSELLTVKNLWKEEKIDCAGGGKTCEVQFWIFAGDSLKPTARKAPNSAAKVLFER